MPWKRRALGRVRQPCGSLGAFYRCFQSGVVRGNVVANGRDPLAARTSHAPIPFPVIAALQMFENNDVTSPNGKMSGCFQGLVKSFWWVMMKPLAFFFVPIIFWLVFFG